MFSEIAFSLRFVSFEFVARCFARRQVLVYPGRFAQIDVFTLPADLPIITGLAQAWPGIREALNKSDFVVILRCSQKISPYISYICCVDIFVRTLSHLELELIQRFLSFDAAPGAFLIEAERNPQARALILWRRFLCSLSHFAQTTTAKNRRSFALRLSRVVARSSSSRAGTRAHAPLIGPSSRIARLTMPRAGRPVKILVSAVWRAASLFSALRCTALIVVSGHSR